MAESTKLKMRELTFEEIRTVYHTFMQDDFDPMEIKPFGRIELDYKAGKYACYGLFDGKKIISYAFFVLTGNGVALLDYLGVREDMRGSGYGTTTLQMLGDLISQYDMVIVESENPDYSESDDKRAEDERRIRFYTKNGFVDTGVTVQLFTVEYRVLEFTGQSRRAHDADQVRSAYSVLYERMLNDDQYKQFCLIR